MQRLTITLDDDLLDAIDRMVDEKGYSSRSEAVRDCLRDGLPKSHEGGHHSDRPAYAVLSYVFEHDMRDLAKRLTSHQHDHHDLSVSTLHIHANETDCLEVAVLKGNAGDLRAYADSVSTQRGVRYANIHLIPQD